jgi:hypothetical protein
VVWGDLTRTKGEGIVDKAREYSRFLIISLTRRTNAFRISTYLTKIALGIVGLLILMATVMSLCAPFWDSKQAKDEAGKGSVFIQVNSNNREIGRGSGNEMRNEVDDTGKPARRNGGKNRTPPKRNCDCTNSGLPREK